MKTMHYSGLENNVGSHLCDCLLGASGKVWRGESKAAICPRVIRMEVKGHFLFPLATLAKVQAVNADKPVWAWNHFHHHGQLLKREKTEFTECSVSSNVTIWTFAFNSKHSCANYKWTELLADTIVLLDLAGHFFWGDGL